MWASSRPFATEGKPTKRPPKDDKSLAPGTILEEDWALQYARKISQVRAQRVRVARVAAWRPRAGSIPFVAAAVGPAQPVRATAGDPWHGPPARMACTAAGGRGPGHDSGRGPGRRPQGPAGDSGHPERLAAPEAPPTLFDGQARSLRIAAPKTRTPSCTLWHPRWQEQTRSWAWLLRRQFIQPIPLESESGTKRRSKVYIVGWNRSAHMTPGGVANRLGVMVITGDGLNTVGLGYGAGTEAPKALDRAYRRAQRNTVKVPKFMLHTIREPVEAQVGACIVKMWPSLDQRGYRCNQYTKYMAELAGIKDIRSRVLRR